MDSVEKHVEGLAEKIVTEDAERRAQELVSRRTHRLVPQSCSNLHYAMQDLFNIAPKRPNWDLKREMDKKLSKLERKTQEAIHTLISTYTLSIIPKASFNALQDNAWPLRRASRTIW